MMFAYLELGVCPSTQGEGWVKIMGTAGVSVISGRVGDWGI